MEFEMEMKKLSNNNNNNSLNIMKNSKLMKYICDVSMSDFPYKFFIYIEGN
jgi:hypothetical protein